MLKGSTYVFTDVMTNEGRGYNRTLGVFTAPVAGRYIFAVQMCPLRYKLASYALAVDGQPIARTHYIDAHDWTCSTLEALVALSVGSKVTVQSQGVGNAIGEGRLRWNTFFGMLI